MMSEPTAPLLFQVSNIVRRVRFNTAGASSSFTADLTSEAPLRIESLGRELVELQGALTICEGHSPDHLVEGWAGSEHHLLQLGDHRAALAAMLDHFKIEIHLPSDEFRALAAMRYDATSTSVLCVSLGAGRSEITFDQVEGLWRDSIAPILLLDDFEISCG